MERKNNDIHLKKNEVYVRIDYNDNLFKAVRHFGVKFLSEGSGYKITIQENHRRRRIHERENGTITSKVNKFYHEILDFGKSTIKYNDTNISINIIQFDRALSKGEMGTDFHKEMEVQVLNNENTLDENKECLRNFCKESIEYYNKEVLDKKKEKGKTSIYIWDDGYWECLEKCVARGIHTVYLDGMEKKIQNIVSNFLTDETREEFESFGVPYKLNLLFHGYPGTGKTSLVYSIASELNMNVALLSFTRKMEDSDFMKSMRRLPDNTILVIEDIDALFESRKKHDEMKNAITFSALLNTLDGIAHSHGQIVIMTTNHPLVLDSALKRPGRVDHSFEFTYANKNQIQKMFETFLKTQKDAFPKFYKQVKHLKLTTAILQQFFFGNMNCDDILEKIPELEKTCNENNYDNKNVLYS